ncbi:hypothetical protein [Niallia sp. 01092]
MIDFFNGLFNIFYGFFAVPLLLVFVVIIFYAVNRRRKRGKSPVEKIEKE